MDVAPDERFLIAFARDAGPAAKLVARLGVGRIVAAALCYLPARVVDGDRGGRPLPGALPAEYERRRAIELAQIAAARRIASGSQGGGRISCGRRWALLGPVRITADSSRHPWQL